MKLIKRIISSAAALTVFSSVFTALPKEEASAATIVSMSPYDVYDINGGKFEGWGTSLCWWANRVGYSDILAQKAADTFFGDNGLRLNIARFNIGGGDDPSHRHITRTDSNMPGYTKYNNGIVTYDWNADYNQRNVLRKCIEAAGDDMIVEMFSNSPPYYMTNSGCSSGAKDSGKNNLRDDKYTDFAEYLAEVTAHYENDWGIHVQSITPMNEPYTNYWGAYSAKQEGCHFDQGASMDKIYQELAKSLKKRNLNDIIISANDESIIDTQITSWNKMSNTTKALIGRIDTHTYGGSQRTQLKNTAISAGRNLWMSEVDGNGTSGQNAGAMSPGLWLAERITGDCNGLNASAWILWQVIDSHVSSVGMNGNKDKGMLDMTKGFWGTAVADHDKNEIVLSKKYYCFGQYTRYIRPGMTMLKSSGNTLAAFDEKNGQLVIVSYNTSAGYSDMVYDLSQFSKCGTSAKAIRTSNSENWADAGKITISGGALKASLAPNSVTTFIIDDVKGGIELTDKIDLSAAKLSGSNSWNNDSSTSYHKAFDGSTGTFFDGVSDGWVQADLGEEYDITALGYAPRSSFEYRMVDGRFLTSTDGQNWSTIYTVNGKPSSGMHYVTSFSGETTARYIRYEVPSGAPKNEYNNDSTYCANIAEIALYGTPHGQSSTRPKYEKLAVVSGEGSGSWRDIASTTFEKAYDGSNSTFFDGLEGGYVQLDLGDVYTIGNIGYCPRSGYEARMIGGFFSASTDGTNWKKIYTIENKPSFKLNYTDEFENVNARYIRYEVPTGAPTSPLSTDNVYLCNVAEIAVYGFASSGVGDVNSDGDTNVADLVMLQKYLLGQGKLTAPQNGDVNIDGVVNIFDLISLRKLVLASSF